MTRSLNLLHDGVPFGVFFQCTFCPQKSATPTLPFIDGTNLNFNLGSVWKLKILAQFNGVFSNNSLHTFHQQSPPLEHKTVHSDVFTDEIPLSLGPILLCAYALGFDPPAAHSRFVKPYRWQAVKSCSES